MSRGLFVAVALLALAGCKKDQPAPEPEPVAEEAAAPEPAAEEVAPVEEAKIEITEDMVVRYTAYQRDWIVAYLDAMKQVNEIAAKTDKDSTLSTLSGVNKMGEVLKKMEEKEAALLKKHSFTEAQRDATRDVVADVATIRMLMKNMGDGQQQMIASFKQAIAQQTDPAQKAEAEAELAKMQQGFDDMNNLVDARKEHGDAAVEAVLKHEAEVIAAHQEALGLLAKH